MKALSFVTLEHDVKEKVEDCVNTIERSPRTVGSDDSFFVVDMDCVRRQHEMWKRHLPFVKPYYAVKCNSDPVLLRCLLNLGVGFDCASVDELRIALRMGAKPTNIIYANPCKTCWALKFAQSAGIQWTTFDNLDELDAIKMFMPTAKVILRIFAHDPTAAIMFGAKFGARVEASHALLCRARTLGLCVVGVSFHIGTGACDGNAMTKAIMDARAVWNIASSLGFDLNILDIGGGFHACNPEFSRMAEVVRDTFHAAAFPPGTNVVAEPGRFFARGAYHLVCRVIARRTKMDKWLDPGPEMLYQNDGVYGNFMNVLTEHEICVPALVKTRIGEGNVRRGGAHTYKIWGPTCDSTDRVSDGVVFGCEVKVDDWLVYPNMGAYSWVTATRFNGFMQQAKTFFHVRDLK